MNDNQEKKRREIEELLRKADESKEEDLFIGDDSEK